MFRRGRKGGREGGGGGEGSREGRGKEEKEGKEKERKVERSTEKKEALFDYFSPSEGFDSVMTVGVRVMVGYQGRTQSGTESRRRIPQSRCVCVCVCTYSCV